MKKVTITENIKHVLLQPLPVCPYLLRGRRHGNHIAEVRTLCVQEDTVGQGLGITNVVQCADKLCGKALGLAMAPPLLEVEEGI